MINNFTRWNQIYEKITQSKNEGIIYSFRIISWNLCDFYKNKSFRVKTDIKIQKFLSVVNYNSFILK